AADTRADHKVDGPPPVEIRSGLRRGACAGDGEEDGKEAGKRGHPSLGNPSSHVRHGGASRETAYLARPIIGQSGAAWSDHCRDREDLPAPRALWRLHE